MTTGAIAQAWSAAEERHHRDWARKPISFDEQRRRRLREILPMVGQTAGDDATLDTVFALPALDVVAARGAGLRAVHLDRLGAAAHHRGGR